ncbi:MAG: MobA/MobL family protein [Xenococcaceae cyanobacterium MO_167.B27]|nr:MobA/MobL family protein [Xenococcaceae cyanobacterium MO_167.B27]
MTEKQREETTRRVVSSWAEIANRALEKAQVNEKIDHRSNEAQGINRIPQIHLGANVNAMMKRGIATEKGDSGT